MLPSTKVVGLQGEHSPTPSCLLRSSRSIGISAKPSSLAEEIDATIARCSVERAALPGWLKKRSVGTITRSACRRDQIRPEWARSTAYQRFVGTASASPTVNRSDELSGVDVRTVSAYSSNDGGNRSAGTEVAYKSTTSLIPRRKSLEILIVRSATVGSEKPQSTVTQAKRSSKFPGSRGARSGITTDGVNIVHRRQNCLCAVVSMSRVCVHYCITAG